jgi:hypothetical protein
MFSDAASEESVLIVYVNWSFDGMTPLCDSWEYDWLIDWFGRLTE